MKRLLKILFLYIPVGYIAVSVLLVLLFKWAPVKFTPLMLERSLDGTATLSCVRANRWTALDEISLALQRSVIASEDARFFEHKGFDFVELKTMKEKHEKLGKKIRGCSTLSQQTAKNCFTSGSRTLLRKAVEAYYTFLIEKIWGKKRILEVYLNVAELGPGIYGAEAASKKYYGKSAAKLSYGESAALVLCLPNPLKRTPDWVNRHMSTRRMEIERISMQTKLLFDRK